MQRALVPACIALAWLSAPAAWAHPHVWIDMRSSVNFNDKGAIDAIGVAWTFDEFYSQFATDGLDKNKNGKLDAGELQELATTYAKNLKEYQYFTFVQTDGKAAETGQPTNAKAVFNNGQLTFAFRLPLKAAVDPAAQKLTFSSFDPTYYIDIAPVAANSVVFTGAAPKACSFALRKIDTTRPGALNIAQSVKMTAPTNDVLNATNATIVDITCAAPKTK
jgi:ABC-type uncharacterized transport system substrate-binding protein